MVPRKSPSIPDGSGGKHIAVCLYSLDRISFTGTGAKTALLQLNPWVPVSALMQGSGIVVNGVSYPNQTIGSTFYVPLGIPNIYATSSNNTIAGAFPTGCDPYQSTSMRVVSVVYKIYYTGPVNTCAGAIRSWENAWTVVSGKQITANTDNPTTGLSLRNTSLAGETTVFSNIGTCVNFVDGVTSIVPPPSTLTVRPEQGMLISLKHRGEEFKSLGIPSTYQGIVLGRDTAQQGNTAIVFDNAVGSIATFKGGVANFDNDWIGQALLLDNVNENASYTLETTFCVEFIPQGNSTMYALAEDVTTKKQNVIDKVEKTLQDTGAAKPLSH